MWEGGEEGIRLCNNRIPPLWGSGPAERYIKSVQKHLYHCRARGTNTLATHTLHYIRCFNPNNRQKSGMFDGAYVVEQVLQSGTVELVGGSMLRCRW